MLNLISLRHSTHEDLVDSIRADTISEVVRDLVCIYSLYGSRPADINDGNCEAFAYDITQAFPEGDIMEGDEVHFFVRYADRFYDAECPEGVDDWKRLPYFKRYPPQSDKLEDVT